MLRELRKYDIASQFFIRDKLPAKLWSTIFGLVEELCSVVSNNFARNSSHYLDEVAVSCSDDIHLSSYVPVLFSWYLSQRFSPNEDVYLYLTSKTKIRETYLRKVVKSRLWYQPNDTRWMKVAVYPGLRCWYCFRLSISIFVKLFAPMHQVSFKTAQDSGTRSWRIARLLNACFLCMGTCTIALQMRRTL